MEIAAIATPSSVSSVTEPTTGDSVSSPSEDSAGSSVAGSSAEESPRPGASSSGDAADSEESVRDVVVAANAPAPGASGIVDAFVAVASWGARSRPGTLTRERFEAVAVDSEEARAPDSSRPSVSMSVSGVELISGFTGTAIAAVELERPRVVTIAAAAHAAAVGIRILIVSAFVRKSGKEASTKWGRRWIRRTTSTSQDCYTTSACLS